MADTISIPKAQLSNLLDIAVPDQRLTRSEAAGYLNVSEVTLWKIRKEGKIKSVFVGKRPFFNKRDLDNYLSRKS